ncbi:Alpha/Beta hydrolase protein [Parachaetomium inaequale]|uniref:Alpha/Beta hydrolase protein n=1 Tax=Parachaetomium inaequale TaxID=2588326 RepID=A0AAN6SP98_9PEZI|nr:Alpha/Beta hydrolase protein [Parachaetomium inaequale]
MYPLHLNPDYQQAAAPFTAIPPPVAHNVQDLRHLNHTSITLTMAAFPCPEAEHVIETTLEYTSQDGTPLTLHRFTPNTNTNTNTIPPYTSSSSSSTYSHPPTGVDGGPLRPAVLYLHGGGFISGSVAHFRKDIARYAHATGTTFFAPAYRLAPEHPYPAPLEDAYAAFEYLRTHAAELGVDRARLGVMGVSAGGGLAAAVALMARDRGVQPAIKKLVLVCPMLDDRTVLQKGDELEPFLTWTGEKNEIAWAAYLAGLKGTGAEVPAYAAPARVENVDGLPRTYIDVGVLDLFKQECSKFASRLWNAGVDLDFCSYPGVPHAWEWIAPRAPMTRKAIENRVRALREL